MIQSGHQFITYNFCWFGSQFIKINRLQKVKKCWSITQIQTQPTRHGFVSISIGPDCRPTYQSAGKPLPTARLPPKFASISVYSHQVLGWWKRWTAAIIGGEIGRILEFPKSRSWYLTRRSSLNPNSVSISSLKETNASDGFLLSLLLVSHSSPNFPFFFLYRLLQH